MQSDERDFKEFDFGFWPEVFGAALTIAIIVFMFAFADGSF